MLDITKIKEKINWIINEKEIDRSRLIGSGAIHYMNANDGTGFDYSANDRSCEFYVFWKTHDGAIKLVVGRTKMIACFYPEENPFGDFERYEFCSPFDLKELCEHLYAEFDYKVRYDEETDEKEETEE